ncbi:MAG: hypothetical protein LIO65_01995 [Odoribacter sp.]|nr:hypothetical protein [Odoribacter sp.]
MLSVSCQKDEIYVEDSGEGKEALLNIYVGKEAMTRLAELPNVDSINNAGTNGLHNMGLYIYYQSDYDGENLSQPYIRNMECQVENGKLVPVLAEGENVSNKNIYLYDNMTIIVFYPYNAAMSEEENWFKTKNDEEKYPITRRDYSQQTYIPYRGEVNANPTNSFYREIHLYPKHTFKIEIVLVSDDPADVDGSGEPKILPDMDPIDNNDFTNQGRREKWYDAELKLPDTGGGSNVLRYTAYIWQSDSFDHIIERNEVLYENGDFTLLASEEIDPKEQRVYRYGYNFSTGEIFIPTSSYLINDANRLQAFNNISYTDAYQVCDIDLSVLGNFEPLTIISSVYDGGGHKVSGMNITGSYESAGLFGKIMGDSRVKNVNLIDPVININSTSDTCYVGSICGQVNSILTDAQLMALLGNIEFPDELSEVVKQALINDLLSDLYDTDSQIIACRVENPTITVTGTNPRVGTVAGMNGAKEDSTKTYEGYIWDTYNLGGTISVNAGNEANNTGAMVGGFCGLNEFYITRCYTTIEGDNITSQIEETITGSDGSITTQLVNKWEGFANQGTLYTTSEGAGMDEVYAIAPDSNTNVTSIETSPPPASWIQYTGIWPINTSTWNDYSANSYWYATSYYNNQYSVLQWERR